MHYATMRQAWRQASARHLPSPVVVAAAVDIFDAVRIRHGARGHARPAASLDPRSLFRRPGTEPAPRACLVGRTSLDCSHSPAAVPEHLADSSCVLESHVVDAVVLCASRKVARSASPRATSSNPAQRPHPVSIEPLHRRQLHVMEMCPPRLGCRLLFPCLLRTRALISTQQPATTRHEARQVSESHRSPRRARFITARGLRIRRRAR